MSSGSSNTNYYHSDHLGTTRNMTDSTGAQVEDAVYTAFGEKISGPDRRYGYAGEWGYQNNSEFPFQHVGARYYDPSSGRFLQRDPIGIKGGLNVYAYVLNRPTAGVDPTGNGFWGAVWTGFKIGAGAVSGIVGGVILAGATTTVGIVVGTALIVVGAAILLNEIKNIFPTARRVVKPVRKPASRRNRAIDNAIDCAGLGMEDD